MTLCHQAKTATRAWLFLLIPLLMSCERPQGTGDVLATYRSTLTLDDNAGGAHRFQYYWPASAALRRKQADVRINLTAFFALHRCGLGPLIGQRNSTLGLTTNNIDHLLYSHKLVAGLRDCHDQLTEENLALQDQIKGWLAVKQRELGTILWNSTFAGVEFARHFSPAASVFPLALTELDPIPTALLSELITLSEQFGTDAVIAEPQIWHAYQWLEQQQFSGRLLKTMAMIANALSQADVMLVTHTNSCPDSRSHRQQLGAGLTTWQTRLYPFSQHVSQLAQAWFSQLDQLLSAQQVPLPPAFRQWHQDFIASDSPSSLRASFTTLMSRQQTRWQAIKANCLVVLQR